MLEFPSIRVIESQLYVMVRKKRGKVLSEQKRKLFETVKDISECIYRNYSQRSQFILMNYFLISICLETILNIIFIFLW